MMSASAQSRDPPSPGLLEEAPWGSGAESGLLDGRWGTAHRAQHGQRQGSKHAKNLPWFFWEIVKDTALLKTKPVFHVRTIKES